MTIRLVLSKDFRELKTPADTIKFLPEKWKRHTSDLETYIFPGIVVQSLSPPLTKGMQFFFRSQSLIAPRVPDTITKEARFCDGVQTLCSSVDAETTLYANPLGRGTFFYVELENRLYASTSLLANGVTFILKLVILVDAGLCSTVDTYLFIQPYPRLCERQRRERSNNSQGD